MYSIEERWVVFIPDCGSHSRKISFVLVAGMTQLSSVDKAAVHNGLKKKVRHLIGLLRSMEVKGGQSPQSVNCWTNIKKREGWT